MAEPRKNLSPTDQPDMAAPARRGRPSTREARREALLEGATALFNARGIAGVSLANVAEHAGLTRPTIYYYVDDRSELAFQCYLRSCERTADDLARASDGPSGMSRVLSYIDFALAADRPQSAVLSDIGSLTDPQAQIVTAADQRNLVTLAGLLKVGVQDGSIRACDCSVVSQIIAGIIAWAQLRPQWVGGRDSRAFRMRVRRSAKALITHGVARRRASFHCTINADSFTGGRFNVFDRRETADTKVAQLLETASQLFNRNGIEATSMDQITAALGATTGVLYHYFRDKTELVSRCYERGFDLFEKIVQTAAETGRTGLERAQIGVHLNAQCQAGTLSPLMPQPGLASLPEDARRRLTRRAAALARLSNNFLREGVKDGSCLELDTVMTSQISAGTFGWLAKRRQKDDAEPQKRLADEICDLWSLGLQSHHDVLRYESSSA